MTRSQIQIIRYRRITVVTNSKPPTNAEELDQFLETAIVKREQTKTVSQANGLATQKPARPRRLTTAVSRLLKRLRRR